MRNNKGPIFLKRWVFNWEKKKRSQESNVPEGKRHRRNFGQCHFLTSRLLGESGKSWDRRRKVRPRSKGTGGKNREGRRHICHEKRGGKKRKRNQSERRGGKEQRELGKYVRKSEGSKNATVKLKKRMGGKI